MLKRLPLLVLVLWLAITVPASAADSPIPPQDYTLPSSYVSVSNGSQLGSALAAQTAQDIVLEDATYDTSSGYFQAAAAHRLWGRTHPVIALDTPGPILTAGLSFGGNSGSGGGEVHGLTFDISDPQKAATGDSAISAWGPRGNGTKVYDSVLKGNYVLAKGLNLKAVQGDVVERVIIRHFRRFGLYLSDCCDDNWYDNTATAQRVTDVNVSGVHETDPGSADGKAEYGAAFGNAVVEPVERLKLEYAHWAGLWTGSSSHDTVFSDVTITTAEKDDAAGIYAEHKTVRDTFTNLDIGPGVHEGINCEWGYGIEPGGCDHVVISNGTIDSSWIGVLLGPWQLNTTITGIVFKNARCAAIIDQGGIGSIFVLNDYTQILGLPIRRSCA
jgi:hypothetical protein